MHKSAPAGQDENHYNLLLSSNGKSASLAIGRRRRQNCLLRFCYTRTTFIVSADCGLVYFANSPHRRRARTQKTLIGLKHWRAVVTTCRKGMDTLKNTGSQHKLGIRGVSPRNFK